MPHKDPEAQKKAMRELMRQRRAQAKVKTAGDNLPPVPGQSISPLAKALDEPNAPPAPATIPKPQPEMSETEKFWQVMGIKNVWPKYPGKEGYPCANGLGRCCLPLMWEELGDTPHQIKECFDHIEHCIYFRCTQSRMEMN